MESAQKLVYIIIPIYNCEKYLVKCLDSIFAQTYKNIKVICVNDGSTDSSSKILSEYKKKFDDLIILNKDNGGLSSARNEGLNYIKSFDNCYITFVDSDDWISFDYIATLVNNLELTKADICCCSYTTCYEDPSKKNIERRRFDNKTYDIFKALKLLFGSVIHSHSQTKLYKGELWKNIQFDENLSFMEDQAITFKLFVKCNAISTIDYCGYNLFMREGSLCRSEMRNKKILDAANAYIQNFEFSYTNLTVKQQKIIHKLNLQQFANIFLMLYARFNEEKATDLEKAEWENIIKFERKYKAVRKLKPKTLKQLFKKACFICCKKHYKQIYNSFIK